MSEAVRHITFGDNDGSENYWDRVSFVMFGRSMEWIEKMSEVNKSNQVSVKLLEWSEPSGHGVSPYYWAIGAKTQTIGYRIDWGGYGLNHTNHPGPFKLMGIGNFPSVGEAKAAAQADFESRIRSALVSA